MKGRALLAWNLRRIRSEQLVSQERLAFDAEMDRAYVSELERERGNASVDILDKLAEALAVPIADFFKMPGKNEKKSAGLKVGRPRNTP